MKKSIGILPIIILLMTNFILGQKIKDVNLLGGAIQESESPFENGLPKGWMRAVDNYECTVKFESGSIYFERLLPDEKCSFAFSQDAENGDYLVKTNFRIDGNEPKILLDGVPLEKENFIKVTDGKMYVGIRTRGAGKVWGNIYKMTVTKVADKKTVTKVAKLSFPSNEVLEKIKLIAANSPITKYEWNDRGKSSIGYIKGVAVTYAKSYLELKSKQNTAVSEMSQVVGDTKKDALAFYEVKTNSDVDRLRAVYTLALGLGMRESSGNTTVGWDKSKLTETPPIEPTAENSEGGLFQVSWDSRDKSPWLLKLYDQYQATPNQCSLSVFMEKVKDKNEQIFGSGDGAKFQTFMKECPALATEYVMVMLRVNRRHFGPINTKKAEYKPDAEKMFKDIEKVIDKTL